jgi:hypothetical protein
MPERLPDFDNAWRELENAIRSAVASRQERPKRGEDGLDGLIEDLGAMGVVTGDAVAELHKLRKVRNLWVHGSTSSDGRQLVEPTEAAVRSAVWFKNVISTVPRVEDVMVKAVTCEPGWTVMEALREMREHDFDALPYQDTGEWFVFSRYHVARWVELEADTSPSSSITLSANATVGDVVGVVGARRPLTTGPREKLAIGVARLAEARPSADLELMLLAVSKKSGVLVLTAGDLPRAVERLVPPHD